MRAEQLKYEEDTDTQAAAERLNAMRRDSADGNLNLPRAQRYIARAYAGVRQSLEDALAVQTRGVGGKYKGWLRKVPLDIAAVIALRECIGTTMSRSTHGHAVCTVQALAKAVGRLYELEVRIKEAEVVNPLYMKRVHEQVKENATTSQSHLRKLYSTAYAAVMKEGEDGKLLEQELIQLGKFGVQACLDAGVLEMEKYSNKSGMVVSYTLAPEVSEFLCDYDDADVQTVLNKTTGAMMCQPDPWTTLNDGGYLSQRRKMAQPLMALNGIRKSERKRVRAAFTAEKMPLVFQTANYMQSIPFSIHKPTMERIASLWVGGGGIMGVPTKDQPTKPPMPFGPTWLKADAPQDELDAFSAWKFSMNKYYTSLKTWRSKVREITGFIRTTREVAERFWFPVFMDRRGRWYYRGFPNPQGSDLAKACLQFADRKPLGERGLYWLKVHIANCYGFDKARFDARAAWTDSNWESIRRGLEDPENHRDVFGDDSPWSMYAAAWELNQALLSANPAAYECGVICHQDATCSGLQHFSAMARDPVGGAYVNLNDAGGDCKQDIYARVSTNAMRVIEQDSTSGDEALSQIALWWLRTGIPRNMAKTPVMTYCYGATLRGTVAFVEDYVKDEMGLRFPEGKRTYDYAAYAAKKLFQGIAATVPAAESTMAWLRGIAKQMPMGKRMEWAAPTGFLVQHDYQDYTETRVFLRSCGVTNAIIREYTEDTKPQAMQNAISPNFVHALDASHLSFTVLAMQRNALAMACIHDSFGTHPCDVDRMHSHIREEFVQMYGNNNVLANFLWEVDGVGEAPMRGTLDLTQVRTSEFFFC